MIKNITYLILTCASLFSYAQTSIKLLNNQRFYLGIENPIILLNNSDTICIDSIQSASSVDIRKARNECLFYITPKNTIEPAFIEINSQKIYFTDNITLTPNPVWMVNIQDGFVRIENLKSLARLIFIHPNFNYDTRYSVKSFFIRIIRDNQEVFTENAKKGRFSNDFKNNLRSDDKVEFLNIILEAPEGIRKLEEIKFKLKN